MVPLLGAIVSIRVTRIDPQSGKLDVILICIGSKGNVRFTGKRIFRLLGHPNVPTPFGSNHEMLSGISIL